MPKLIRIYNLTSAADEAAVPKQPVTPREKRLFVALSLLMSVNVLLLSGLATFVVLLRR